MQSLNDHDYDDVDGGMMRVRPVPASTLEVHAPDSNPDPALVDNKDRPTSARGRPSSGRRDIYRGGATVVGNNLGATMRIISKPQTPRSGDLLEMSAHRFTDEKPFQPRTLRSNTQSKLSDFKYYTAPKKRPSNTFEQSSSRNQTRTMSKMNSTSRGMTHTMRPETPMTLNSTDLMNETLMSRNDFNAKTPTGVPPLNISLDKDHMKWLKEQSQKAQVRSGHRSRSDLGSTGLGGTQKGLTQNGDLIQNGNMTYYGGTLTGTGQMTG